MHTSLQTMTVAIAVAVVALSAPLDNAEAKRRIGGSWISSSKKTPKAADDRNGTSLPIVIPSLSLGSSNKKPIGVVKVADLPNTADFQREDGSYVDLGWRYVGETGGEWVGYIGSDDNYLTVSPDQLTTIMQIAGLTTLPEPPTRIGQHAQSPGGEGSNTGGGSGLWTLLQIAAFVYILLMARRRFLPKSETAAPDGAEAAAAADWMLKAESRMGISGAPRTTAPMRASTVVRGSPSTFGRRA